MIWIKKGITHKYDSEDDILNFLSNNNYYFRVISYRKNYTKDFGKYVNLDFAYLKELSTIDMHLRFIIIKMCLDIEHILKVNLINKIQNNEKEDGYNIVSNFLEENPYVVKKLWEHKTSTYCGQIIKKYFKFENKEKLKKPIECPVWAFFEVIPFGTLIGFYRYYLNRYESNNDIKDILNPIKSIRNGCAHNNCILHNLNKESTKANQIITKFVSKIDGMTKGFRNNRLQVRVIYEFTCLLYAYNKLIPDTIKYKRFEELNDLFKNRMLRHSDYFKSQKNIASNYEFLQKIIDFLVK